jgi:hypothetical protein
VCPPAARLPIHDAKAYKRHLSQDHALFECDICEYWLPERPLSHMVHFTMCLSLTCMIHPCVIGAESQMLFTWERTLFARKELVQHKRSKTSDGKLNTRNMVHPMR